MLLLGASRVGVWLEVGIWEGNRLVAAVGSVVGAKDTEGSTGISVTDEGLVDIDG